MTSLAGDECSITDGFISGDDFRAWHLISKKVFSSKLAKTNFFEILGILTFSETNDEFKQKLFMCHHKHYKKYSFHPSIGIKIPTSS